MAWAEKHSSDQFQQAPPEIDDLLLLWEAIDDCYSLLASFAASFPLRRSSSIATPDMARYLLTRSEGTIGKLAHLSPK